MNGNKLKSLRENQGLLQKDLSNILHISTSTIGMYEQGRREPDNATLKKIAGYFGVSTDYLLDIEQPITKVEKELREKEILKNALIENGYMNKDEDLTNEELKRLMEFVKTNKKYIKESKPLFWNKFAIVFGIIASVASSCISYISFPKNWNILIKIIATIGTFILIFIICLLLYNIIYSR